MLAVLAVIRKPGGQAIGPVAVAHPDLRSVPDAGQKAAAVEDPEGGETVLALARRDDPAAQEVGRELETVADAQDGHAEVEDLLSGRGARLSRRRSAGPPDRMSALGPAARIRAMGVSNGTISE